MAEWYYQKGGRRFGPVRGRELKRLAEAGELLAGDLVWREGMRDWRPASAAKGLFGKPDDDQGPPPLPTPGRAADESPPPVDLGVPLTPVRQAGPRVSAPRVSADMKLAWKVIGFGCLGLVGLWFVLGFASLIFLSVHPVTIPNAGTPTDRAPVALSEPAGHNPQPGADHGSLASFEDHPAPVIASLRAGKEVWLLDGCSPLGDESDETRKSALYLILTDGRVEFVVLKSFIQLRSDRIPETGWKRFYRGESESWSTNRITYNWDWTDGSPELHKLKCTTTFRAMTLDIESVSQSEIKAELNRANGQATWSVGMQSDTTTRLKTTGKVMKDHNGRTAVGEGCVLRP